MADSDAATFSGTVKVFATLSGEIIPTENIPDVTFTEKLAGDGFCNQAD